MTLYLYCPHVDEGDPGHTVKTIRDETEIVFHLCDACRKMGHDAYLLDHFDPNHEP